MFGWGGCLSLRSLNIELGNSGDPVVSETDAAAGWGRDGREQPGALAADTHRPRLGSGWAAVWAERSLQKAGSVRDWQQACWQMVA